MNEQTATLVNELIGTIAGGSLVHVIESKIRDSTFFDCCALPIPFTSKEVEDLSNMLASYIAHSSQRGMEVEFATERPVVGSNIDAERFAQLHSLDFLFESWGRLVQSGDAQAVATYLVCILLRYRFCSDKDRFFSYGPFLNFLELNAARQNGTGSWSVTTTDVIHKLRIILSAIDGHTW